MLNKLSLIVPVYNEEESISLFLREVHLVFAHQLDIELEIIFINDGSEDNTLKELIIQQRKYQTIKIIDLSRNFGKEAALSAGLKESTGDIIVPIDVDLQDPPKLILKMIKKWKQGYEVVLAHRNNRDSDSFLKRTTAGLFYKVHNLISKNKLPENVGDFRLMDRKVVNAINQLKESSRFMKGLFAWVGFSTATVQYSRKKRQAGKTKFSGWKLWNFALEGFTSFSTFPLRVWTYLGFFVAVLAFIYGVWVLLKVALFGADTPGFATIIVAISFLGGLQLMGIGMIGEYLGRTYIESKQRPIYLVKKIYQTQRNESKES